MKVTIKTAAPKVRTHEVKRTGAGGHRDKKYDLKGRKACRKNDPRKFDRAY